MSTSVRDKGRIGLDLIQSSYEEAEGVLRKADEELAEAKLRAVAILAEAEQRTRKMVNDTEQQCLEKLRMANINAQEIQLGASAIREQSFRKEKMTMRVYLTECGLATLLVMTAGCFAVYGPHQMSGYIISGLFGTVSSTLLLHTHFRGPKSAPQRELSGHKKKPSN